MIGILYESNEWSDFRLQEELEALSYQVRMLNMQYTRNTDAAYNCDLLINRVFSAAQMRGHQAALARTPAVLSEAARRHIPVLNPGQAHFFETDKARANAVLKSAHLPVPNVLMFGKPEFMLADALPYPCVIKPNCGGSRYSYVAHDENEFMGFMKRAVPIEYVVEDYLAPVTGFITRVEVLSGECISTMRRNAEADELAGYGILAPYQYYDDCSKAVKDIALQAAATLGIYMGGFDIVECWHGPVVVDVNAVSDITAECDRLSGFSLMRQYAAYIAAYSTRLMRQKPVRAAAMATAASQPLELLEQPLPAII
jgi:ribosomal protein S6--L-glutamate ligase